MKRSSGFVAAFFVVVTSAASVASLAGCEDKAGPLRVDKVDPAEGTTGGGDQVTISGNGFQPGKTQAQVFFGRRRAETVVISSPTAITVMTPPGDKGPVDITVDFDEGSRFKIPAGFKFLAPSAPADTRKAYFSGNKK